MKFAAVVAVALPVLAAANPFVVKRACTAETANILASLRDVVANVTSLNATLNSFGDNQTPNGTQDYNGLVQGNAIATNLNNTVNYCRAACPSTAKETTRTFDYLNGTVYPATYELLSNFIAHFPAYNQSGLAGIVYNDLVQQKNLTDELGACLKGIAKGDTKKAAALQKKTDAIFSKAIKVYTPASS